MFIGAFLIQFGLHVSTAAMAFALGARLPEASTAGLPLLATLAALAVAGMAALGAALGRRGALGRGTQAGIEAVAQVDPARHDALTGLPNRAAFCERLGTALGGARRGDRSSAVLRLDLADFKAINETLGCVAGDLLLRHSSTRLLAVLRASDMLARVGADEFAILQSGVAAPADAADLAERLLAALAEPFELCGQLTHVGARVGIALAPRDGAEVEALLQHAGLALGRAKAGPPRTVRFFEERMDRELREQKALEQDLAQALGRGELELEYQPQFDIRSRRMFGVEALLRWRHPHRGRIGPDHFIPLAEDSGLILPIGRWVLEQACLQAASWQRRGVHGLRMAVNLSPVQCRDPELAGQVADILRRTGLAAPQLQLEITERVLMEDTEANLQTLGQLKRLGVRISLDDFGVGHSSLGYLRRFPFDELKLDRSFVGALTHDAGAQAIVRAALSLGRGLGLDAVAEGVESIEQLELLDAEGCRLAQGYYFSPPVHPREIDAMVAALAGAAEDEAMLQGRQVTN
ncbi:MAG TPA: bifunctional diguanylate cyclase/phosphodiesterase [Geminicoccaceae bacterium]|nr:bifunctional diguanylate cyclase/phosphodiesterase [Geminicoccaceae bacterium]